MKIESAEYKIQLNSDEIRGLAYCVHRDLMRSIKEHYNCLQQSKDGEPIFKDMEKDKIRMMKFLFQIVGEFYFSINCESEYISMFEQKRKERREND